MPRGRSQRRASLSDLLGAHEFGAKIVVGAAAAFGEIAAERFQALIERARALGASGLRLTPWRAFLIAGLDREAASSMLGSIAGLGFIASADEPRLRIAACPGAPACMHGHRPVREDAARWAALMPKGEGVVLHVSGCAKGCARAAATAVTLDRDRGGLRSHSRRQGGRPARAARPVEREDRSSFSSAEGVRMFAGERPSP